MDNSVCGAQNTRLSYKTPHCPTLLTTCKTPICCSHSSLTHKDLCFLPFLYIQDHVFPLSFPCQGQRDFPKPTFLHAPALHTVLNDFTSTLHQTKHLSIPQGPLWKDHCLLPTVRVTFPLRTPLPSSGRGGQLAPIPVHLSVNFLPRELLLCTWLILMCTKKYELSALYKGI